MTQIILFERGILVPGMTKAGGKRGDMNPNLALSMVAVLGAQADFKNVVDPSLVVSGVSKKLRGVCNHASQVPLRDQSDIELVWGRSKYWVVRKNCKYTIQ